MRAYPHRKVCDWFPALWTGCFWGVVIAGTVALVHIIIPAGVMIAQNWR